MPGSTKTWDCRGSLPALSIKCRCQPRHVHCSHDSRPDPLGTRLPAAPSGLHPGAQQHYRSGCRNRRMPSPGAGYRRRLGNRPSRCPRFRRHAVVRRPRYLDSRPRQHSRRGGRAAGPPGGRALSRRAGSAHQRALGPAQPFCRRCPLRRQDAARHALHQQERGKPAGRRGAGEGRDRQRVGAGAELLSRARRLAAVGSATPADYAGASIDHV